MTSTSSDQDMIGSRYIAGARNASILILYLLFAASMFGVSLLHHVAWVTRCQDAIDMSHTASAFAKTYAGMDITKTIDFRSSLNSTMTRTLDEKLPALISRACASLDVFKASPALRLAYMICAAIYGLSVVVLYTQVSSLEDERPGIVNGSYANDGVDRMHSADDGYIRESISVGFLIGCRVATVVWMFILSSLPWSSAYEGFDYTALISIEGLLFSMLPAIGILTSIAWPWNLLKIHPQPNGAVDAIEKC